MKTVWPLVTATALLVSLSFSPSGATWSYDPQENNLICGAAWIQSEPALATDGAGGAIIVWGDGREGDYASRVYGQHVDAWGHMLWEHYGITVCTDTVFQDSPKVVSDGEGGAVAVWRDRRSGNYDLYAQRLDPWGNPIWDPAGVPVCVDTALQESHVVVSDGNQGAIVAWVDHRAGYGNWDVYAQRLDGSGAALWDTAGVALCEATGNQYLLSLTSDGAGGAIVGWNDHRTDPDSADVYVQRVKSDGHVDWTADGVPVCTAPRNQDMDGVVSDGAGGCIVCWDDQRSGGIDVYAQRVNALGYVSWLVDGLPVAATGVGEHTPALVSDGQGGAIIAWLDARNSGNSTDVYAQRLDRWGNSLWASGGVPVCAVPGAQRELELVSDGAGGVVVAWTDWRVSNYEIDVYAERLDADGNVLWQADGVPVCTQTDDEGDVRLTTDGSGGAIITWCHGDIESFEGDIYAQRVEGHGYLGYPAPFIFEISDYPNDQGGVVIVSWAPSYLDAYPHTVVTDYSVWRRIPERGSRDVSRQDLAGLSALTGLSCETVAELCRSGWSYVDLVPASYWTEYGYDAPTYADSTASGVRLTEYMIVAQTDDQWMFWESLPAVGYSVDNLAPGAPVNLAALGVETDVELTWSPSNEDDEDLAAYNVYRGDAPGFVPDETTFVDAVADTSYTDLSPGGGVWYYLVAAEDVHGNEGPPSNEASAETWTGFDDPGFPAVFALRGNRPNPFNPSTEIRFDLPSTVDVQLTIYAVDGRRVAMLNDGVMEPGGHAVTWNGRDDSGASLPSGVYFARLEAGEKTAVHKMVILR